MTDSQQNIKCAMGPQNIIVWAKIFNSLVNTGGEDLSFTFDKLGIHMSTFDIALSVCAGCTLHKNFFARYDVTVEEPFNFKVPLKSLLSAFKMDKFMTKLATSCIFICRPSQERLDLHFNTSCGIVMKYELAFSCIEEQMELDFDPDSLKNFILADPKVILTSLANFKGANPDKSELTFKLDGNKLFIKNRAAELLQKGITDDGVYTELSISPASFDEYEFHESSEVTFSMREFREFVNLADVLKLQTCINFQESTHPVVVSLRNENLEVKVTMASKIVRAGGSQPTQRSSTKTNTKTSTKAHSSVRKRRKSNPKSQNMPFSSSNSRGYSLSVTKKTANVPDLSERFISSANASRQNSIPDPPVTSRPDNNWRKDYKHLFPSSEPYIIEGEDVVLVPASDEEDL